MLEYRHCARWREQVVHAKRYNDADGGSGILEMRTGQKSRERAQRDVL